MSVTEIFLNTMHMDFWTYLVQRMFWVQQRRKRHNDDNDKKVGSAKANQPVATMSSDKNLQISVATSCMELTAFGRVSRCSLSLRCTAPVVCRPAPRPP